MSSRALPLLALMIAIGTFFAYINPTWTGPIATTRAEIANDQKIIDAAREYKKKENELASARNAIDPANLTRLENLLPDAVDNVGLILDINALAARSGLSLSNIDIIGTTDSGSSAPDTVSPDGSVAVGRPSPVSSVDLSLTAIGTYNALQSFLGGIEKSARLLDIRDMVVKGSETGVYSYQMVVRLYWLR